MALTHYIAGFAKITVGDSEPKPAIGAYIYFSKNGGIKRAGQFMGRTLGPAGSYIYASFLTDELVRGGGQIMGIDEDFGVRAFTGNTWGGPGGIFGTYIRMPALHFVVGPTEMEDHQAPYGDLRFEVRDPDGTFRQVESASVGDEVYASIRAHDNKTPYNKLVLDLKVNGVPHPQCNGDCSSTQHWGTLETLSVDRGGTVVFRFKLANLGEGRHSVNATIYDEKCNKAQPAKDLLVLAFSSVPCTPAADRAKGSLLIQGDSASVSTDTLVKVRFTGAVRGLSSDSLILERLENGAWVQEPAKVIGPAGALSGQQGCEAAILTPGPLKSATQYQVRWTGTVQDAVGRTPEGSPLSFATTSYALLPSLAVPAGRIADVAAIGNMVYVGVGDRVTGAERIHAWIYENGTWMPQGTIGPAADGTFFGQDIVRARAFADVSLGGGQRGNLLLVTTTPKNWQSGDQSVLWGYRACGNPELLFAVSLGASASAYAPSVDCRDGVIAVGRLTSSVALIDIGRAMAGWSEWLNGGGSVGDVRRPGGANWRAIFQSFYLTDPDGTAAGSMGAHWGVGVIPGAQESSGDLQRISVAVGYLAQPMRGLPNVVMEGQPGGMWMPRPAFDGPKGGVDVRAVACPLTGGVGATRVGILSGIEVMDADGSNRRTTSLGLGLQSTLGRIYIVDEGDPKAPKELGYWQAPGKILYRMSAIDEITKRFVVPVTLPEGTVWYLLDLSVPSKPRVIAELKGLGVTGAMSHGVLYTADGLGQLTAVDFNRQTEAAVSMAKGVMADISAAIMDDKKVVCPSILSIEHPKLTSPTLWINRDAENGGRPTMSNVAIGAAFTPDTDGITQRATYDWSAKISYEFKRRKDRGGNITLIESFPNTTTQGRQSGTGGWNPRSLFQDANNEDLIRGGTLEVTVKAEGQTAERNAKSKNAIQVFGENPSPCDVVRLLEALEPDAERRKWLLKIAMHESKGKQFNDRTEGPYNLKGEPVLNGGGDGGMGMFQITRSIQPNLRWPFLWRWDSNAEAAVELLRAKVEEVTDMNFPERVRRWANGEGLKLLNQYREFQNLPPFTKVEVPDYPDPATYILEDAIRYFNGFGSRDPITGLDKHEFFPKMVRAENPDSPYRPTVHRTYTKEKWNKTLKKVEVIVVAEVVAVVFDVLDVVPSTSDPKVAISRGWDRYPVSSRKKPWTGEAEGDPNYVENLRKKEGLQCK